MNLRGIPLMTSTIMTFLTYFFSFNSFPRQTTIFRMCAISPHLLRANSFAASIKRLHIVRRLRVRGNDENRGRQVVVSNDCQKKSPGSPHYLSHFYYFLYFLSHAARGLFCGKWYGMRTRQTTFFIYFSWPWFFLFFFPDETRGCSRSWRKARLFGTCRLSSGISFSYLSYGKY